MIQRLLPAYFFSLECYFLFFLLFFFYVQRADVPSITAFLIIIFVGNLILYFSQKQKLISGTVPFIGAIILGGVCYFLGLTNMSVFVCTVFLYFRIAAFIKDSSLWKEDRAHFAILFYCSSLIVFIAGWIFRYPYMNWMYGMVIGFTVLYSMGRFLQQIEGNKEGKAVAGFAGVLGVGVLLTGVLTILVPVVKWMFFKIMSGLAVIAALMGRPIFYLLEQIEFIAKPMDPVEDEFTQGETGQPVVDHSINPNNYMPLWLVITLLIVAVLIIWYFVRKKKMMTDQTDEQSNIKLEYIPATVKTNKKRRFLREPAPNEYIRKLFYQLQIYADKHEMGRYEHETIREWFQRVDFPKNDELFLAYENVRYGKGQMNKEDALHFEVVIQGIKREIKERNKKDMG